MKICMEDMTDINTIVYYSLGLLTGVCVSCATFCILILRLHKRLSKLHEELQKTLESMGELVEELMRSGGR